MQSKKICRRRADLKYFRHGHLDYLDPAVVIGPQFNQKGCFELSGAMKQEVSIMHGKLAGKQSFLVQTFEAGIMLCNANMSAHDHCQRVIELKSPRFSWMRPG